MRLTGDGQGGLLGGGVGHVVVDEGGGVLGDGQLDAQFFSEEKGILTGQ